MELKVNTKFNEGDTVYLWLENRLAKGKINKIDYVTYRGITGSWDVDYEVYAKCDWDGDYISDTFTRHNEKELFTYEEIKEMFNSLEKE